MTPTFFPDPLFGWAFFAVLAAFLGVAAYIDTRSYKIPKPLTLALLGAGLVANVVRGAWLSAAGGDVWLFPGGNAALGALDGLLFALAGFALGFGLFFVLWVLGACGGGDVKLFAALGAWLGISSVVLALIVTIVLVVLISGTRFVWSVITRGRTGTQRQFSASYEVKKGPNAKPAGVPKARLVSYSLPLAVAAVLVVLWVYRVDLRLAPPKQDNQQRAEVHAR